MSLYIYYLLIIFSKGDMLCFRPLLLFINVKKLYLVFSKGDFIFTHPSLFSVKELDYNPSL